MSCATGERIPCSRVAQERASTQPQTPPHLSPEPDWAYGVGLAPLVGILGQITTTLSDFQPSIPDRSPATLHTVSAKSTSAAKPRTECNLLVFSALRGLAPMPSPGRVAGTATCRKQRTCPFPSKLRPSTLESSRNLALLRFRLRRTPYDAVYRRVHMHR
jgi:hypothetical protein